MWNRLRTFMVPPVFPGNDEKTNAARLINIFLIFGALAGLIFPIIGWLANSPIESRTYTLVATLLFSSVFLKIGLQQGRVQLVGAVLTAIWWGLFTIGMYAFGGLHDTAITGIIFVLILSSAVGSRRVLIVFSGLSIFSLLGVYYAENSGLISPVIEFPAPAIDLILPVLVVILATFFLRSIVSSLTNAYQRFRDSAEDLAQANQELAASRDDLTRQTRYLERRARYLTANATVARDSVTILDPNILLRRVATLISEQFDFYHTGIFLNDSLQEYAVLQAASSDGGKRMLARGHRLSVGKEGIVGYVAQTGQARVALDTGEDAVFFNNPDLPETRSEAALPLKAGDEIIGVLDVQSTEPQAFDADDIEVLQTLADQVAMSIQTARLYQQAQESLAAQRRAYGEASRDAWLNLVRARPAQGYQFTRGELVTIQAGQNTNPDSELPEINIPIRMGGSVIGFIKAHKPKKDQHWSDEESRMLETLSGQLSVALESARLYQDTQRQAAQEQVASQITARIRETLDIESILKTASEEIRLALDLPEVIIRLGDPASSGTQQRS